MIGRTFLDTNVLVYAIDGADSRKQARAREILGAAAEDGDVAVSAQVLSEFYVVVTAKLRIPLGVDDARRMVEQLARLHVVPIDADLVLSAINGSRDWQMSFWDALIVRAASNAGCTRILTEDLSDGREYGGVRIENPFAGA